MMHVVRKMYWDYDREEKWLNKMAANGLSLRARAFFVYVFEDTPKNEYSYKVELLKNPPAHPETKQYIEFLAETGIEFVAEYQNVGYFRKKTSEGELIIYSDNESKIKQYKKRFRIIFTLACFELFLALFYALQMIFYASIYRNIILIILYSLIFTLGIVFFVLALRIRNRIRKLKKEQIVIQ